MTEGLTLREATADDAPRVTALINQAYRVEDFFKIGDRIDVPGVLEKLRQGRFVLLEDAGELAGLIYVAVNGPVGYFGLLSIAPSRQRQGQGARLIRIAEDACRDAGCTEMELQVVNLRTELFPYYRKFGYEERGTRPFPDEEHTSQPCHFIVMGKAL